MKKISKLISIKKGNRYHTKKYIPRIEVSFLTILIFALSLFTTYFKYIFLTYIIGLVHELAHILVARILNVRVESIKFLPIGFCAELENFDFVKRWKQFLILIAGPISYFVSAILLSFCYKIGMISFYTLRALNSSNLAIALFNLIPFYPLDGARLFEILVSSIVNEKKSRIVRLVISFLSLIILSVYLIYTSQVIGSIYMLFVFLMQVIAFKKDYIGYLYKRLISGNSRKVKITKKDEIYRHFYTVKRVEDRFMSEKSLVSKLIYKESRKENH